MSVELVFGVVRVGWPQFQPCRSIPQPRPLRCGRFWRSKWPLEKCCLLFSFCSAPLCFVHVMHGFTLYIYMCVYKYTFASSSMHRFFQRASNMISQIWKSMLPESVKLEVSQYTTPDSWIQFVSRHEEHRAGPPIPPKNPITDVFMNGTGSWAPFDPFNYY